MYIGGIVMTVLVACFGLFYGWYYNSRYDEIPCYIIPCSSSHMVARRFDQPIQVNPVFPPYVSHPPLENVIGSLSNGICGVHVLWGPHGSGKTTSVQVIARH